ncbi:hypothetical protein GF318_04730 [Candidatus Micrarchaeota archaeon]|nr:hypothetical protein [Candidatus Micrarchaeota archaeon]
MNRVPACPHCHIYKGLWSPMVKSKDGIFICKADMTHKFKRDREGNFHSA